VRLPALAFTLTFAFGFTFATFLTCTLRFIAPSGCPVPLFVLTSVSLSQYSGRGQGEGTTACTQAVCLPNLTFTLTFAFGLALAAFFACTVRFIAPSCCPVPLLLSSAV
jgi:hypothetical protein